MRKSSLLLIFIALLFGCHDNGAATTRRPRQRIMLTIHYHVVTATAYTTGRRCCGKWADGKTCHNIPAKVGRTIATDERFLPHHRWYFIQGIGWRRAEDRGGKIKGWHVDILVKNIKTARRFGVQRRVITW